MCVLSSVVNSSSLADDHLPRLSLLHQGGISPCLPRQFIIQQFQTLEHDQIRVTNSPLEVALMFITCAENERQKRQGCRVFASSIVSLSLSHSPCRRSFSFPFCLQHVFYVLSSRDVSCALLRCVSSSREDCSCRIVRVSCQISAPLID